MDNKDDNGIMLSAFSSAASPPPITSGSTTTTTIAALKEWAVVCKALEEGRQVLLLRKGGIMEYRKGFEVKHTIFFLFPTFEHQSKESIQSDYVNNVDIVVQDAPTYGKSKITSYAKVVEAKEISEKFILQKLEKYHIWNERYINIRMNYNPVKPMSVILLRVYKMGSPIYVDIRPEWSGCKSWIPIGILPHHQPHQREYSKQLPPTLTSSSMIDAHPVLDESKFDQIATEIRKVLK